MWCTSAKNHESWLAVVDKVIALIINSLQLFWATRDNWALYAMCSVQPVCCTKQIVYFKKHFVVFQESCLLITTPIFEAIISNVCLS